MRAPELKGAHGRAWRGDLDEGMRAKWPAALDLWLVHAPAAHPFWKYFIVSAVSLADAPNTPPAVVARPGATHELMVIALDPTFTPEQAWCSEGEERWSRFMLRPLNLAAQVVDLTDEQMNELAYLFVRACCYGQASPDDDHRGHNLALLDTTADHLRRGMHVPS